MTNVGNMNWLEYWFIHSCGWRAVSQRYWELPLLQKLGLNCTGKRVLEIGCGNGSASNLLSKLGAISVLGVDVADVPGKRRHPNVSFAVMDATHLTLPDQSVDLVLSLGALHHIENWEKAISEATRVLSPTGGFAFIDFTAIGAGRWFMFDPPSGKYTTGQLLQCLSLNNLRLVDCTHRFFGDVVFGYAVKN